MSIVNYLPELPKEGSVVFADNGKYSSDRAIFKNGEFVGGGDYPVMPYTMSFVLKWFYLDEYDEKMGGGSYLIGFEEAENL